MVHSKPTFRDLVDRLTRENIDWVEHDDGDALHSRKGMLLQLREAVFGGLETGGSSSAFGSRPTIDATALDLLEQITIQATEALATVDPHPTPYGHAERYVSLWAAQTDQDALVRVSVRRERALTTEEEKQRPVPPRVYRHMIETTAYELAQSWLSAIDEYLNPASLREIRGACPSCGETDVKRERDGEFVQSSALSFVHDRDTGVTKEAKCAACGATWAPEVFDWLARVVGAAMTLQELLAQYTDGDEHGWESEFAWLRRKHRVKLDKLKSSIEANGIERPILLGWDNRVWDGHHRLCVADELGLTTVPVKIEAKPKNAPADAP